jgi:hypothetical protein
MKLGKIEALVSDSSGAEPKRIVVEVGLKVFGPDSKMKTDVPAPKLILAKSYVFRCGCCHRWLWRAPQMWGDEGDSCEVCGCTSCTIREGRPYGPKSKGWADLEREWEKDWPLLADDIIDYWPDTVVTDPPLAELRETVKRDLYGDEANWQ